MGFSDAYDPEQNILGGAKYLRMMLDQFGGNTELAVAAYNAGPGNVSKYGGIPPSRRRRPTFGWSWRPMGGGSLPAGELPAAPDAALCGAGSASARGFGSDDTLSSLLLLQILEMQIGMLGNPQDDKENGNYF